MSRNQQPSLLTIAHHSGTPQFKSRMWFCIGLLVVGGLAPTLVTTGADEAPAGLTLTRSWEDDFETDARDNYLVRGQATWDKSKLTLQPGSRLDRKFACGPRARVEAKIDPIELNENRPQHTLRIWCGLEDANSCCVTLKSTWKAGNSSTRLAVFDTRSERGQVATRQLAAIDLPSPDVKRINFEYRHGVIRVSTEQVNSTLTAFVNRGTRNVASFGIEAVNGTTVLRRWAVNGVSRREPLSEEAKQQLAKARALEEEALRLHQMRDFIPAEHGARTAMEIRKIATGPYNAEYATSVNGLAMQLVMQGKYDTARPFFEEALEIRRQVVGEYHPDYAQSLNNIGMLYYRSGQATKAGPFYQQANEVYRVALGDTHPIYATGLHNLAMYHESANQFDLADKTYRRAMELRRAHDPRSQNYATTLECFGRMQKRRGRFEEAEDLLKRHSEIVRSGAGERHMAYAISLDYLADLYRVMKRYDQAEQHYSRSLEIRKSLFGNRHPAYGECLTNLGVLYQTMGEFAKARPCYETCMEIAGEHFGKDHLTYATAVNNLGFICARLDEHERAEELLQIGLKIRKREVGDDHPEYANGLVNLAFLYKNTNREQQARLLLSQAAEIFQSKLGEHDPLHVDVLEHLAGIHKGLREYQQAERIYKRVTKIVDRFPGKEHPRYLIHLNNLANLYSEMGRFDDAETLCQRAISICESQSGSDDSHVASLNNLATLYGKMGAYQKAKPIIEKALVIDRRIHGEDHHKYGSLLSNAALLYADLGDYRRGIELAKRAVKISRDKLDEDDPHYATSLNTLGFLHVRLGDYAAAKPLLLEGLALREKTKGENPREVVGSLNSLGDLYASTGEYLLSEPYYQRAHDILATEVDEDDRLFGTSLNNLAIAKKFLGEFEESASLMAQAVRNAKVAYGENHPQYAMTLSNQASTFERMGDFPKAKEAYLAAAAIFKRTVGANHPSYAFCIGNLATLHQGVGEYDRAMELHQKALAIEKKVYGESHSEVALRLGKIGSLHLARGQFEQAEKLIELARSMRETSLGVEHPDYILSLNDLGLLHQALGDSSKAKQQFEEARDLALAVHKERHPEYATVLFNLAWTYIARGDLSAAEKAFKDVVRIRKDLYGSTHPKYAVALDALAQFYMTNGNHVNARPILEEAVSILEKTGANREQYFVSRSNLATLYLEMGEVTRAEPIIRDTVRYFEEIHGENHAMYLFALVNLAGLHEEKADDAEAQAVYKKAADIASRNLDMQAVLLSERQQKLNMLQSRFMLDLRVAAALRTGAGAADILPSIWKWKGSVTIRQRAYRLVADNPDVAPLFQELRTVSRQMSALLNHSPSAADSAIETEDASREKRKRWMQAFGTLRERREEIEKDIAAKAAAYIEQPDALLFNDVVKRLPAGTAYIEILTCHDRYTNKAGKLAWGPLKYVAFVVRPDQEPVTVDLGPAVSLRSAVVDFRRAFGAELRRTQPSIVREILVKSQKAARDLRQDFWQPLEQHLKGVETVVFSPDTALGTLPLGALPGPKQGSFLLEQYRFVSMPLVSMLRSEDTESPLAAKLLVVGDVDYGKRRNKTTSPDVLAENGARRNWAQLPGFLAELDAVRTIFESQFGEQGSLAVLSGTEATEEAFLRLARERGTLHVITHAYFTDASATLPVARVEREAARLGIKRMEEQFVNSWMPSLLSGIVLAGANADPIGSGQDDGILRSTEIEATSLENVDLVVLSACETGLGSVTFGEGLTGLQRAFHIAGARTVVASLWEAEDTATRILMERFYTNLWKKKMRKVDALREAQLWMLRNPQQLRDSGIREPQARGDIGPLAKTQLTQPGSDGDRTSPYYWATFQLSGDWR